MSHLKEVKIRSRSFFTYELGCLEVDQVIKWRFFTRSRSLGFGLYLSNRDPSSFEITEPHLNKATPKKPHPGAKDTSDMLVIFFKFSTETRMKAVPT